MPGRPAGTQVGAINPLPVLMLVAVVGLFIAPVYALGAEFLLIPGTLLGFTLTLIGGILTSSAHSRQRQARLHDSGVPVARLADAGDGAVVRVVGAVTSEATVEAPFSGRRVVHAVTSVCQSSSRPAPRRRFKDGIWCRQLEVDDGSGRAVVELDGEALLSKHTTEILGLCLHAGSSEAQRAIYRRLGEIYPTVDFQGGSYDLHERAILPGDVIQVTGKLTRRNCGDAASEAPPDDETNRTRAAISRPPDRPLLITNLSEDEIREMYSSAERLLPRARLTLMAGVALGGLCLLWMFAS